MSAALFFDQGDIHQPLMRIGGLPPGTSDFGMKLEERGQGMAGT